MTGRRALLSVGLALLLLAPPLSAGEAPPAPIDPVAVARLLLDEDPVARERGVGLLLERVNQGGDLAVFFRAMAEAQVRLRAPEASRPAQAEKSLAAEAREAIDRLVREAEAMRNQLKADAAEPPPSAAPQAAAVPQAGAVAHPPAAESKQAAPVPARPVETWILQVGTEEFEPWRTAPATGERFPAGPTAIGHAEALAVLQAAAALPGSQPLLDEIHDFGATSEDLLRHRTVSYRQGVRRTKGGAYALRSAGIPEGLRVLGWASGPAGQAPTLHVRVRFTDVPRPLAVTRIRPAQDVAAIEVDNPEWRSASAELAIEVKKGERAAFVFPGVVPGKVVVVGLAAK